MQCDFVASLPNTTDTNIPALAPSLCAHDKFLWTQRPTILPLLTKRMLSFQLKLIRFCCLTLANMTQILIHLRCLLPISCSWPRDSMPISTTDDQLQPSTKRMLSSQLNAIRFCCLTLANMIQILTHLRCDSFLGKMAIRVSELQIDFWLCGFYQWICSPFCAIFSGQFFCSSWNSDFGWWIGCGKIVIWDIVWAFCFVWCFYLCGYPCACYENATERWYIRKSVSYPNPSCSIFSPMRLFFPLGPVFSEHEYGRRQAQVM